MSDRLSGQLGFERPLIAIEEISWTFNAVDCFNAAIVAHIGGRTTLEGWRSALDAVQHRHALLSVRIETPDGHGVGEAQPFFRETPEAPIALRVIPWGEAPRWEAEVEHELSHPFEPGDCPTIRASIIHGDAETILILAATHAITDGLSLAFLVRDILSALSGEDIARLPCPLSAEALLGFDPASHGPVERDTAGQDPEERRSNIPTVSTLRVAGEATRRILAACHRNGCTLHGALVAAVVIAMRRCAPEYMTKPIRSISPISIREMAGAGEANGMYIVLRGKAFDPKVDPAFWDLAREARSDIVEASGRDAVRASMVGMRQLVSQGMTVEAASAALDEEFALDVLVTNLGRVPYPARFGSLTLEALFPAVANVQPASQAVAAATVGDTLCLLNASREPIAGLLEAVHSILSGLSEGQESP